MTSAGRGTPVPRLDAEVASTAALAAVTVAAALGMGRLFEDGSYLAPLVLVALVCHGLCWSFRRGGLPVAVTALVTMAVLGLVAVWVVLPHTTWYGVPGVATIDAAIRELRLARALFADVVAPAPVTRGFLLAAMVGVGVTAFLADWSAFRLESLFEALLPSFLLVVFTAFLGGERHRAAFVVAYLIAVAAFLLLHSHWLHGLTVPWLADRSGGELGWRLPTGAVLGGAALVAGVLVGAGLAGADSPSELWRRRSGDRRTTVSPLVDIRGRLVNQSAEEAFTVRSSARSYWRLTSLDTFDGRVWSSDVTHLAVSGRLPAGPAGESAGNRVIQEFTISSLSSPWLPAAYRPRRVEGVEGLRYNEPLDSLVADDQTRRGLTYRVASSIPRLRADELDQAGASAEGLPELERFLRLPSVSPRVRQLAARLTAASGGSSPSGAGSVGLSPFQKALALQHFFRQGFTYDLEARPGHDERALEGFLFRDRRGYCEQFAGAYAVLSRAVGLPTRVAVGFTTGELGADGLYHVRGLNAHAWPEVYMEGHGWVAFEPTPGRGAPGASYTGVPESQAQPDDPGSTTTAAPSTTTAVPATTAPPTPDEVLVPADPRAERASPLAWLAITLVVSAPLLLVLLAVPMAKRARRRRRRRAAVMTADRVLVAWLEAAEALAQAGAPRRADETLDEHAERANGASKLSPPAADALTDLASAAAAASYGAMPLDGRVATEAVDAAALVEKTLSEGATRPERLRRTLDPRPLLADQSRLNRFLKRLPIWPKASGRPLSRTDWVADCHPALPILRRLRSKTKAQPSMRKNPK